MSKLETVDFNARQGSDFHRSFRVIGDDGNPLDLTGYDIKCQVRSSQEQEARLLFDFVKEGCIGIDPADSHWIEMRVPANRLDRLNFNAGVGDVRISKNDRTDTLFVFNFKVRSGISV